MWNSQLLIQAHICLNTTMLPAVIVSRISETLSEAPQLNVFFVGVVVVIVFLHSNKNSKTEVGTRDWGIAVIGLTMCLSEGI